MASHRRRAASVALLLALFLITLTTVPLQQPPPRTGAAPQLRTPPASVARDPRPSAPTRCPPRLWVDAVTAADTEGRVCAGDLTAGCCDAAGDALQGGARCGAGPPPEILPDGSLRGDSCNATVDAVPGRRCCTHHAWCVGCCVRAAHTDARDGDPFEKQAVLQLRFRAVARRTVAQPPAVRLLHMCAAQCRFEHQALYHQNRYATPWHHCY